MAEAELRVSQHGFDLIDEPRLNKGSAFPDDERSAFGLHGLLPPAITTMEIQVARTYAAYGQKDADIEAAAREVIRPDALTWVIVGDLKKIEEPVRALKLGDVKVLYADGKTLR